MDTGGYTGSWGPEGKLAVLHEKEIILNKEDTKNFLGAIGILRELSNTLDLKAMQSSSAGLNLLYKNQIPNTTQSIKENVIEQTIQIQAEFPDATDHIQIQEAFNNLINSAS